MADLKSEIYEAKPFQENKEIKNYDAMKPALDGTTASTWSTSAKSEISSEIGRPVNNGSLKMEKIHQFQLRTESSCSNSSIKIEENIRSLNKRDNQPAFHFEERTTSSGESENILSTEMKPLMMHKTKSEFTENKSSLKKTGKYDQDTLGVGFDLNEDFNTNGSDDLIEPVSESISSHSVTHVIAKTGISRGLPVMPLKFEGRLDWKGHAETSAFRRTHSGDYSSKGQKSNFTGFDLNASAEEDNPFNGLLQNSRLEVGLKKAESPSFDLNCLYDASDEFTPHNLPRGPEKPRLIDLNLNVNTEIGETGNSVHWLGHGQESLVNKNPNIANPRKGNFNCNAYLADSSAMQYAYDQARSQQYFMGVPNMHQQMDFMQRVAPFHPNLHALPPQNYSGPFQCSGMMPYMKFSQEHDFSHERRNPDIVHASFRAPRHLQFAHGNISTSTTKVEGRNEEYLSRSGSMANEARQFTIPSKSSQPDEQVKFLHQDGWYASNMKRKEPEGGLDYHQLG